MSCVLKLVISAIIFQKVVAHPVEQTTLSTRATTEIMEDIEKMGQEIEEIPEGWTHAKTLNLAYNQISSLPENVFFDKSYKGLTKIKLSQNKICTVHITAFRGLRQLTSVVLASNNITSLDPYTFKYNHKLERLDLSNNNIAFDRVKVFLMSQNLETLIISHNRIEKIYEVTFMGLPNLKKLILDDNELFMIAPNSFKPLSKLHYLSIANTGVYHLSESMFNSNLPGIVNLQETPLAKIFDPPLKMITNDAVGNLILLKPRFFPNDSV